MTISFSDYPVVIDPSTEACELRDGTPSHRRWKQIPRVNTAEVLKQFSGIPVNVVHFFGVHQSLWDNDWILGYDVGGLLTVIIAIKSEDDWCVEIMPQEATGGAIEYPSVRLVFTDERARQSFTHYLDQVAAGRIHNPDVALMLQRMAEPVRMVSVWSDRE